jgi:hypothetical protein
VSGGDWIAIWWNLAILVRSDCFAGSFSFALGIGKIVLSYAVLQGLSACGRCWAQITKIGEVVVTLPSLGFEKIVSKNNDDTIFGWALGWEENC